MTRMVKIWLWPASASGLAVTSGTARNLTALFNRDDYASMSTQRFLYAILVSSAALATLRNSVAEEGVLDAVPRGVEAYVYGYPLVTMEITRRVMTNVEQPAGTRAPMGQFVRMREYPTAQFRDVTALTCPRVGNQSIS